VALATVASLVVSFYAIDGKSLLGDEAISVQVATSPLRQFARTVLFDEPFNGLYYVLLRGWLTVWGTDEAALRSMSAIATAGAIPALYVVGRELAGMRGGLIAVGLAISNAFVIHFSQVGRAYAVAYLLVALSYVVLIRAMGRPKPGALVAFTAVALVAAYAHFYAVFVLVTQLAWAIAASPRRQRGQWLLVAGVAVVALSPLALGVFSGPTRGWIVGPTPGSVLGVVLALTGAAVDTIISPVAVALAALGLGLAVVAVRAAWTRPTDWAAAPELMLAAGVLFPLGAATAVSLFKPILVARYLIVVVPALILLLAVGFARARPAALAAGLAALAIASGALQVGVWYRADTNLDFRSAVTRILAEDAPGDGVLLFPPASFKTLAVEYYVERLAQTGPRPVVHRFAGIERPTRRVAHLREQHDRLWLLLTRPPDDLSPGAQRWLDAFSDAYGPSQPVQYGQLTLLLYTAS
jgi:mannosyltransferase